MEGANEAVLEPSNGCDSEIPMGFRDRRQLRACLQLCGARLIPELFSGVLPQACGTPDIDSSVIGVGVALCENY